MRQFLPVLLYVLILSDVRAEIPTDLLGQWDAIVRHRTAGIREEERPLLNRILFETVSQGEDELRREASADLDSRKTALRGETSSGRYSPFNDAFRNPEECTGLAFTLRGHLRRLEKLESVSGEGEAKGREIPVYEAWLFTEESQGNPWVVLFSELPEGITPGPDLNERVEVVGYFVKLASYQAQDARRVVPMIVAPRLQKVVSDDSRGTTNRWLYGGLVLLLLLGCVGWWKTRSSRRRVERLRARLKDGSIVDEFNELPDISTQDSGTET